MASKFKLIFHTTVEVCPEELVAALKGLEVAIDEVAEQESPKKDTATDVDEDFEAPAKKKASKKAAPKAFDEDDVTEEAASETDDESNSETDEDVNEKKPALKKSGKVSIEDVNDACKAKVHALIDQGVAGAEARQRVVEILTRKFKVKSISNLKKEQYAPVIAAMK